jgi:hypothetical protein
MGKNGFILALINGDKPLDTDAIISAIKAPSPLKLASKKNA